MTIKLIISDIDGVWTDGGMYYLENGVEAKKFNTSDSVGVLLASIAEIELVVITGEDILCVRRRMEKLKINHFHLGVKDKLSLVEQMIQQRNITFDQVAFIGDEINDHALLHAVGFSACPQTAPSYTQAIVDYVVPTDGGKGAFRDFVMEVLKRQNLLTQAFEQLTGHEYNPG